MKQKVYLGIDTSCYTTSVAVLDEAGKLVGEARKILDVKPGRCGLQQSEMVFQHTRNLPNLMEEVLLGKEYELAAIGVSGYPRPLENSYMPAFLAGTGVARTLAAATGASCVEAYDALGGLKSLEELRTKIAAGWEKN